MYPIITEKAPNTYDIFGVKLEPINDIKKTIINSDDPLIIEPSKSKALKRILSQGTSDDLFIKGADNKQCVDIEYWLNVSQEILLKRAGYFRYNSIAQIYTTSRLYSPVYDNIINIFEDYFATDDDIKSKIYLLYDLNRYIRTFKAIGFKLVRCTEKKTVTDYSKIIPFWFGSPNCFLRANTEALMVLTGATSYIEEGKEAPIILDGKVRKLIPWTDVTPPRALNDKFCSTYSSK